MTFFSLSQRLGNNKIVEKNFFSTFVAVSTRLLQSMSDPARLDPDPGSGSEEPDTDPGGRRDPGSLALLLGET